MEWIAYCTDCHKVLDHCPNALFVEAAAKRHKDENPITDKYPHGHRVLVGYEIK
jgi:hypothetical protein